MKEELQRRIRLYRKERGLTVRQLAERAGCTHSYISQIEKGTTAPSLSMVGKLAAALGINVVELFNEPPNGHDADYYLARNERKTINYPDGKVSSQLLVSRIATKKMEPLVSAIQPGGSSDEAEKMVHPPGTEEFVLVLKGEIEFKVNGKAMRLREGDTLSFDGTLPHRWENRTKKKAEALFVFSPPIW
ncbi:MAG: helix-turn-helix domain-containing protein [Desulfobacterota bacterium]|nr:helix-turn-helix domain-containing protein [Thermodesulfobacteriota bacterium]